MDYFHFFEKLLDGIVPSCIPSWNQVGKEPARRMLPPPLARCPATMAERWRPEATSSAAAPDPRPTHGRGRPRRARCRRRRSPPAAHSPALTTTETAMATGEPQAMPPSRARLCLPSCDRGVVRRGHRRRRRPPSGCQSPAPSTCHGAAVRLLRPCMRADEGKVTGEEKKEKEKGKKK